MHRFGSLICWRKEATQSASYVCLVGIPERFYLRLSCVKQETQRFESVRKEQSVSENVPEERHVLLKAILSPFDG